jgi:hypothetical protein
VKTTNREEVVIKQDRKSIDWKAYDTLPIALATIETL